MFCNRVIGPCARPRDSGRATPCLQIAVIDRRTGTELGNGLAASNRDVPPMTRANGMLMARQES